MSGTEIDQRGLFLELSWGGKEPLQPQSGKDITFLKDGNTLAMSATAPGPGGSLISFSDVVGSILPAR